MKNSIKVIIVSILILVLGKENSIYSQSTPLHHTPWTLIIYRPENSEQMNDVRCYVKFEDAETGEDVTYTKIKANYSWVSTPKIAHNYQRSYYLSGGMLMHINIRPGKYNITVTTPKNKNNGFKTSNNGDWTSNTYYYDTDNPLKVIFVMPTSNESGFYNGGWIIYHKAPEYFKFTKPVITEN